LCIIVKNERLVNRGTMWSQLRRRASRMSGKADVTIIVHSIEDVNEQRERGRYFFSDVKKEGILLHDSGRFTLAEEKPSTPAERQAYAQACFDNYLMRAGRFYKHYESDLQDGVYGPAAFQLHQAAESCYKTVLLVFTAYLPKSHRLEVLGKQCGDLHPAFRNVFPTAPPDDRRRFELLEAAYVEARYSMEFSIAREDLEILAGHVRELCTRVEQACRERIADMAPPQ
jgi:HEPN domain-containing protein